MQPTPTTQTRANRQLLAVTGLLLMALVAMAGVFWLQTKQLARNDEVLQPAAPAVMSSETTDASMATKAAPAQSYLEVPEWAIRIPLSANSGQPAYTLKADTDGAGALFVSSRELSQVDANCNPESGQLGLLERAKIPLQAASGQREPLQIIDGYYYYYSGPQALCLTPGKTDTTENEALVDMQQTAFAEAVRSLTAR